MEVLLVNKPFKTNGEYYGVGAVIQDPSAIRYLTSKLGERKIVQVNEHTYATYAQSYLDKYNVNCFESLEIALGIKKAEEPEAPDTQTGEQPETPNVERPVAPKVEQPKAAKIVLK